MKLLAVALVIVLVTMASAKPFRGRFGHKGGIRGFGNKHWRPGGLKWWTWLCNRNSNEEGSSSDQSEESSESSEESSEEVTVSDLTTTTMATITTRGRSTLSPGPVTATTDQPTASPPATTTTTPVVVTSPISVTKNATQGIPTAAPITDNRGDS